MELDLKQLRALIGELQALRDEMIWFAAEWLQVSTLSVNKSHLLRKSDYEQDKRQKALCGKLPNEAWNEHWDVTPILDGPGSLNVCQVCLKLYEKSR